MTLRTADDPETDVRSDVVATRNNTKAKKQGAALAGVSEKVSFLSLSYEEFLFSRFSRRVFPALTLL